MAQSKIANLAWYEILIIRFKIYWISHRHSWQTIYEHIEYEMYTLHDKVVTVDEHKHMQTVSISPLFGISRSSLHWSINMLMEHLVLETGGVIKLIEQLNSGYDSIDTITIQSLQPQNNKSMHKLLHMLVRKFSLYVETNKVKRSKLSKKHPYFGKLNSKEWLVFLALHMRMHRLQLERIVEAVTVKS